MGRLRRLKKGNDKIKATACGLALALVIGSTQGLGTYALFTDTEDVASNLAISTGDVDVDILRESFIETNVQPESVYTYDFEIKNLGTLNQNISIELTDITSNKIYSYINSYNIVFDKGIDEIDNLKLGKQELKANGKAYILKPGETITCNAKITMKSIEDQDSLIGSTLNMKLNIEATQLNERDNIEKGFYDIDIVQNTLTIGKSNIISHGNGMKYAGNGGNNDFIEISFNDTYSYTKLEGIQILETKGQFEIDKATVSIDNKNTFTIKLNKYTDSSNFSEIFNNTDFIVLQFNYKDVTFKKVHFDFRQNPNASGNEKVEAMYTVIEMYVPESSKETISTSQEDIVVGIVPELCEPMVVEYIKEERIEIQNQPEEIQTLNEIEDIQK